VEHSLIDEVEFTKQQPCLLNQVELCHVLQDPIATWMESSISRVPNVAYFSMTSICSCEYGLYMEFLLHMLCSFHAFNFMQEGMSINQFLVWLHWKFDYT
jgi:hypothetical protein